MGLSRASLYNKLKAMTNMGANDYINKFRMEKAIQLISTTDLTFTEIAEKIGFTTSRYFSTSFKQYTGETPTQYKEKIRKKSLRASHTGGSLQSVEKLLSLIHMEILLLLVIIQVEELLRNIWVMRIQIRMLNRKLNP